MEHQERGPETLDLKSGQIVADVVEKIYEKIPEKIGSELATSNAVLCLAGLKPETGLFVKTKEKIGATDKEVAKATMEANEMFEKISPEIRILSTGESDDSGVGNIVWMQLQNLSALERITKLTRIPGVPVFNKEQGFKGAETWAKEFSGNLEKLQEAKQIPQDQATIQIIMEGITLGYPDQAIYDFLDWYITGRNKELQDANITGTGTYQEPQPVFDFYPEHANDPDIQENIRQASKILTEFYESDWHKKVAKDSRFTLKPY